MRHIEHQEARAFVEWWTYEARKRQIDERLLIHIANEGRVGGPGQVRAGYRKKLEGLRPGVPDYFLAIPRYKNDPGLGYYPGLWIELKAPDGKLSLNQNEMIQILADQGYKVAVCFGWGQASDAIKDYLGWQ